MSKSKGRGRGYRPSKSRQPMISERRLITEYGLTKEIISQYFPRPEISFSRTGVPIARWPLRVVQEQVSSRPVLNAVKKLREERERAEREALEAAKFLQTFSPEDMLEQGKLLKRRFIIHEGPTNSGKTYDALQALKAADSGTYLGPLRLLALEMFDTLNADGCPCTLLTGEEYQEVPFARVVASTIELCNYEKRYDVAVIDEAQMMADPSRGNNWTKAICLVNAAEVHVCTAPEALALLEKMLKRMGAPYEIHHHDRLVPLEFAGVFKDIDSIEPGDALIAFSRRKVLSIAAHLETKGIRSSVIYGALPPAARREEVRRFAEKETQAVIATDAIGMGISLPIRRVVFIESEKFDGVERRKLNTSEIKQIAGRAGRFGKYNLGQVLSMTDQQRIRSAMGEETPAVEKLTIPFPTEALEYHLPLDKMLRIWNELPEEELFARASMQDAEFLLAKLRNLGYGNKELVYRLITCPVDIKDEFLVSYWRSCCLAVLQNVGLPMPPFDTHTLEGCERQYKAYDVRHQLLRRIGIEEDCSAEKEALCEKINQFLSTDKNGYLLRCSRCGKLLPIDSAFGLCQKCFEKQLFQPGKYPPGKKEGRREK